jgi:hypothetical protein
MEKYVDALRTMIAGRNARIGLAVTLVIVVGLIFANHQISNYAAELEQPALAALHVQIDRPASGESFQAGTFHIVQITALSSATVSSLELWDNGQLVELISGPQTGSGPFIAPLSWRPLEAGPHMLIARAYDSAGASGDSAPLSIQVLPNEKVRAADLAQQPAFEIEYSGPSAPTISIPAPGASDPPAAPQNFSPVSAWIGQIFSDPPKQAPVAPNLSGLVQGCGVLLSFEDMSANESGFYVYRALANNSDWQLIASLNSANGGLQNYSDDIGPGLFSYRVAAFNIQGETASNPLAIEIPGANCTSPAPPDSPFVQVLFTELIMQTPVQDAYCYMGGGVKPWQRWPADGFLQSVEGGFDINNPIILSQLFPAGSESIPLDLELNCWAWQDNALIFLGHSQYSGDLPSGPGQFELGNINYEMVLASQLSFNDPVYDYSQGVDFSDYLLRPEAIPIVGDVNLCQSRFHIDSGFPSNFCTHSLGYSSWLYEPTYVVWNHDYAKNCAAGEDCLNPGNPSSFWKDVPGVEGGQFGYEIYTVNGWSGDIPTPLNRVFALPASYSSLDCEEQVQINVKTYFVPAGSATRYTSQGTWVMVPAPCRTADFTIMEIAIEEVWLINPFEESNEGEKVDLYGYFALIDQFYQGQGRRLAAWGDNFSIFDVHCNSEDYNLYPQTLCPTSVIAGENGIYYPEEWRMCNANDFGNDCWFGPTVNLSLANNVFDEITIVDWETTDTILNSPQVWVKLMDRDVHSADDVICEGYISLADAGYPFAAYNDFDGYTAGFTIQGSGDHGESCLVQLSLTDIFSLIEN